MSKGMTLVVRICGWLFLGVALLSLFGRDNPTDLADKASLYLAPFLAHFGILARSGSRAPEGFGRTLGRLATGLFGGLVGGYALWNALQYVAAALRGGRFDAAASWGTLVLAVGLGYLLSSPPRRQPVAAQ